LIEALSGGTYSGLYELVEDVLGIDTNQGQTIPELTAWEQSRIYEAIDHWIEVDYADSVVFTLDAPYAPFLSMLAHGNTVSSILDREWCAAVGSWDGEPETWAAHNTGDASDSPLYDFANGTGAFLLESLQPDQVAILVRFDGYWRGPAQLERVEILLIPKEATRAAALESGAADIADIFSADSLAWIEGMDSVVTQVDLPRLTMSPVALFNTEIVLDDNSLVGSGELGQDGIPSDFFADVHVRKAFAYAFDGWAYIDQLLWGTGGGYETIGPIPKAFRWAYEDNPFLAYPYDLEKAEVEMKLAYDGMLWDAGFTMTLLYYTGNYERELQWLIWQDNIESLNPRFDIEVRSVTSGEYWDLWGSGRIPLLTGGWLADYPDPHNFARAFASSEGYYARHFPLGDTLRAALADSYDPLISAAVAATDQEERASIYRSIQAMLYEDCFYVWLPQGSGCRVMRDWVQGWRFNPAFPGPYFYTMYKG
jgi:peptide/nickel transport system substrate-binding protein